MSESSETIRVNFGRPMPLFPLHGVVLLPHAVMPLHIFEPRYRQMVESALDGAGQIAIATFEGERWKQEYHGTPPLRPVVCVGHIVQHERLFDGRYNILLQGVCRAMIKEENPTDSERLFREAILKPVGAGEVDEAELPGVRDRMLDLLEAPPLTELAAAKGIVDCLQNEDAPTAAVLELISISIVADNELKYRLLSEADPAARAAMIERELISLRGLLKRAELQVDHEAPRGVTWN
ncbi:MAG: hypothetical protein EA376_03590 [Phycisphaeraceae bacterium]|nr:MAG: hypothetical protein EA376_03590 [Phycisphaeraceae bacterium]